MFVASPLQTKIIDVIIGLNVIKKMRKFLNARQNLFTRNNWNFIVTKIILQFYSKVVFWWLLKTVANSNNMLCLLIFTVEEFIILTKNFTERFSIFYDLSQIPENFFDLVTA